ncbi:MAG: hypothetical protein JWP89_4837 [Schlesneria sp.]|nr:hypothetical protein [Schlesneria sp.]
MAVIEINWRPSDRDLRLFAVVQWFVAAAAAWLLHKKFGWDIAAIALLVASSAGLVGGLLVPLILRPLFIAWMVAAFPIGWVMSHLVLAIVYYTVITPIGFALRLAGRDTLQRNATPDATTYWTARPQPRESSRYFRQF